MRWLLAAVLVLAIVAGGATIPGGTGDWIIVIAAIPLFAVALYAQLSRPAVDWPLLGLVALTLALPLLQLVQWPGTGAPPFAGVHRGWQFDQATVFGIETGRSLSVAPDATLRTFFSFIPPLAVLLAWLALPAPDDRPLTRLLIGLALASALFGFVQIALGGRVDLQLHTLAATAEAKGLFSNRNHFGTLMVVGIALVGGAMIVAIRRALASDQLARHGPRLVGWALALAILVIALMLARSRAAIVLGAFVVIALALMLLVGRRGGLARGRRLALIGFAIAALAGIQAGLWGVLERFRADPFEDGRVVVQATTLAAANEAAPWGTGMGTFRRVYEQREPADRVIAAYINRAHNDWLELYLEAGWFGLGIASLWIGWIGWRVCRRGARGADDGEPGALAPILLRRVALLALAAIALHSVVDFPMRTIALACVVAALTAIAAGGPMRRDLYRRSVEDGAVDRFADAAPIDPDRALGLRSLALTSTVTAGASMRLPR